MARSTTRLVTTVFFSQPTESLTLNIACLLYICFAAAILFSGSNSRYRLPISVIAISALSMHSLSLASRWVRLEHGPFINLHEILSSNLWSNMLGLTLFYLLFPNLAKLLRFALFVILILMAWLLVTPGPDSHLPPTYNTPWLYYHVISGKIFFTLLLLATSTAIHSLSLRTPDDNDRQALTELAYRFLTFAFVAESLMLLFGAIWAQDAWGRYWSWDPLETWAFVTWLVMVFTLHLQVEARRPRLFTWLIPVCFTLAFLTFFGVPFISTAAHQGMV